MDYRLPQYDSITSKSGFTLRSGSMEIRLRVDKALLDTRNDYFYLKCVARNSKFESQTRERSMRVNIVTNDYLSIQKLINYRSQGKHQFTK